MRDTIISHEVEPSVADPRTLAKVKFYIFTYILLGQMFYQLCRQNIGFAQLTMSKELVLTPEAFGLAAGIFAISGFLMQVPSGLLYERFKARRWMTFNMAAWGGCVICQGLVHNKVELISLRFLLGLFEAGFLPGVYILIHTWFRGKDQGVATSFVMIGLGLSAVVGGPFAGWVLDKHFFGLSGWRSLFLLEGAVTVLWSIVALRILSDEPADTSWLEPGERISMVRYLAKYHADRQRHVPMVSSGMWSSLKDARVRLLILAYTCSGWTAATFLFFNPSLLKVAGSGISNQYVGFLAVGPYVTGAVASYFWGKHADRTERHLHCVLPLLLCAIGVLLYPVAKRSPSLAMVSLAIIQVGNMGFFVNFWPSCNLVIGGEAIAKATALINAGTQIGSFFAPVYFGRSIKFTGSTSVGLYTCLAVILTNFVVMNVFFLRYRVQAKTCLDQTY